MLIEALQQAQGTDRDALNDWLTRTTFDKADKVRAVTAIYDQLGIRQLTESRITDYFDRGFANFDQIDADPDRKKLLIQFARQLVERES